MKFNGTMKVNERGHLEVGGCDTVELVRRFGSPLYVIDEALLRETCRRFYKSFMSDGRGKVIYAGKAFLTRAVCRIIEEENLGLDVVSGGELYTALKAGFPAAKIYFHGNNKSDDELRLALEHGVGRVVVDNFFELDRLADLAAQNRTRVKILLRVTPGIEAHTHHYIKTGQIDSKFGFTLPNGEALAAVKEALTKKNLKLVGLHCHIGSQVFEMDSYTHAAEVMLDLLEQIRQETGKTLDELDLGGGFGIFYAEGDRPVSIEEYAQAVLDAVAEGAQRRNLPLPKVVVEPGRAIIGPAGTTLYTVGAIKDIPGIRKYVAVDGGMADNIRPALYEAKYQVALANKMVEPPAETVSVTGKCCESGDMLAWDVELPPVKAGDILVMPATGAYCYSMASNYNRLGRPAVVVAEKGRAELILRRETYEDMLTTDVLPERLQKNEEENEAQVSVASLG